MLIRVSRCGTSALYDTDSTTALSQTDLQELEKRGVALGILAAFGIAMIAFVLLMVTFPILSVIGAIVFPFVIVFGLLDLIFGGSN